MTERDKRVDGENEFEQGVKFGIYICRERPHILKALRSRKPNKDIPFEMGIQAAIHQHLKNQLKRTIEARRSPKPQSHDRER